MTTFNCKFVRARRKTAWVRTMIKKREEEKGRRKRIG
jgi:hypothetical protein